MADIVKSSTKMTTKGKRHRSCETDDCELPPVKKFPCQQEISTQLLDLNIDCLGQIFEFLTPADLMNVIDLSSDAAEAALIVFSRRYSKFEVHIWPYSDSSYPDYGNSPIEIIDDVIEINSPIECSKFLKVFGYLIKKLMIAGFNDETLTSDWRTVMRAISKYCSKYLIELDLVKCNALLSNEFQCAFEEVVKFRVQRSQLDKCKYLNEWFPNIKHLELMDIGFLITVQIIMPNITEIEVHEKCLSKADVDTIIESAPQLQELTLDAPKNVRLLHLINERMPLLKRLSLTRVYLLGETSEKITFKNLEFFSIDLGQIKSPTELPFKFEKLTELEVNAIVYNEAWIDFAIEQCFLVKLRLTSYTDLCVNEINKLFSQCKTLEVFRVSACQDDHELIEQIKVNWNITEDNNELIIGRKINQMK